MPISSVHPKYKAQENDWETMRDSLAGDHAIRAKIQKYLPPPPGMNTIGTHDINDILGMSRKGIQSRYSHYATFAEWPEIVQMTINAIQGLIHEKPPTVVLPTELQYLEDTATPAGDNLNELWETMTRETFSTGRIALLDEIFDDLTYICPYVAESVVNWHVKPKLLGGGPTMVILRETHTTPKPEDDFEHEEVTAYRELRLAQQVNESGEPIGEPVYRVRIWEAPENKDPRIVVNEDTDESGWIVPQFFGQAWAEIPITINNTEDRTWKYGAIPLISAARRAISIFRKTADYFRALYNKGDPQAILFGVSKSEVPSTIGGSMIWAFEDADGSAMYLDIDGQGIPLQRQAIEDQYARFAQETGRLIDSSDTEGVKSGEALRREAAGSQVTVKSIVINAGASMQAHLRRMARLMGKSQSVIDAIEFTPNLDFSEPLMSGEEFMKYVLAKNAGGPLSWQTIHEIARRHKITDKSFEDEEAEIEAEGPSDAEIQRELDQEVALEAAKSAGGDNTQNGNEDTQNGGNAAPNSGKPGKKVPPKAKPAEGK